MEPRGRSRRVRKLATDVPAIESINREQASNEISSNLYYLVGRRAGEGMNYRLPLKLDKRFGIKRLKALWVMTFTRTTNQGNMKKWLILIKKYFGVMDCPGERKVKITMFLLQEDAEN